MSEMMETGAIGGEVVVTSSEIQQGRVLAVVGYIIPLVALIVCLTRRSAYHGYHGRQSLMVMVTAIAASIALIPVNIALMVVGLGVLTVVVGLGYMIVFLGLVVVGCINAWNGRQQPLPVIGTFAERVFGRFGG
ncbi:MAG: hypothetical protein D6744_06790 [Planctomycetota bacterium]|nr:MAG: hypothetical protein D6744_06790 [Planctomycetota bacterium]